MKLNGRYTFPGEQKSPTPQEEIILNIAIDRTNHHSSETTTTQGIYIYINI